MRTPEEVGKELRLAVEAGARYGPIDCIDPHDGSLQEEADRILASAIRERDEEHKAEVQELVRIETIQANEAAERAIEALAKVSRLMCGNDEFPGDLAQYVQNEIDGRKAATARADRLAEECKEQRLSEELLMAGESDPATMRYGDCLARLANAKQRVDSHRDLEDKA